MDWGTERLAINRKVRRILVAHFVDIGRLAFTVYPGRILFRGSLVRMEGGPGDLTPNLVRTIFDAILSENSAINRISTQFDNWVQRGPRDWEPVSGQHGRETKRKAARMLTHPAMARPPETKVLQVLSYDTPGADTSLGSSASR